MTNENNNMKRRDFLGSIARVGVAIGIGGLGGYLVGRASKEDMVWQLDPSLCIQCGRCADHCALSPSAVKCVHVYDMCGYCDLCGGYFRPETKELTTAAENQLCPTNAIKRTFVEEPFFEYEIDEDLCIGCGKCVKGCSAFGNGSLQLQVRHNICVNCNECSIARACPSKAFKRVPASNPYLLVGFEDKKGNKKEDSQ
jgi:electron transport complex protein RnfB